MAEIVKGAAEQLRHFKNVVNTKLPYEPIYLVGGAVLATSGAYYLIDSIPPDGVYNGLRRLAFRVIKTIPAVQRKIEEEMSATDTALREDVSKLFKPKRKGQEFSYIKVLPCKGLQEKDIMDKTANYVDLGTYSWEEGVVSGTVYDGGENVLKLCSKVYELTAFSNPLHPDVFPGICKMEAEIIQMVTDLLHGGPNVCGTVTSGGTESLLLAVKAYRDYALEKGIKRPEILAPVTAHAGFDKAAQLMGINIKHVPVVSGTYKVDMKKMEKMISGNTCMLVGSAPGYPHGVIDDIQAIGALGKKHNIPVHVDACFGAFLIVFMDKAGYPLKPFDFRVPGVTSISADTHKYGYTPKGSSVLMFTDIKYKHHQYFMQPDWPGGLYASPTLAGSRAGSLIATCWASLLSFGMEGYIKRTKQIISTARCIREGIKKIHGIKLMGEPEVSIIAIESDCFDIYLFQDGMNKKGWRLNALQFPPGVHFAITYAHMKPDFTKNFLADAAFVVKCLLENPSAEARGVAAIYGSSQTIPDRTLVSEVTARYLDKLYLTDYDQDDKKKPKST